ncbi:MAG: SEL1-like repeat protein [Verrucomicrobia bacterium]|nr:SEL1-like repeat protein [Verrucomicrobiota bacterium]
MNSSLTVALVYLGSLALTVNAQSVGRIRKSLDKATGGATAAPARPAPPPSSAAAVSATAAAAAAPKVPKESAAEVDQRVITFLNQRIEDGSADAAFDLAKRYEEGKGVPVDPKESRRLYSLAAERGNEEAKAWLEAHPAPAEVAPAAAEAAKPGTTPATPAPANPAEKPAKP